MYELPLGAVMNAATMGVQPVRSGWQNVNQKMVDAAGDVQNFVQGPNGVIANLPDPMEMGKLQAMANGMMIDPGQTYARDIQSNSQNSNRIAQGVNTLGRGIASVGQGIGKRKAEERDFERQKQLIALRQGAASKKESEALEKKIRTARNIEKAVLAGAMDPKAGHDKILGLGPEAYEAIFPQGVAGTYENQTSPQPTPQQTYDSQSTSPIESPSPAAPAVAAPGEATPYSTGLQTPQPLMLGPDAQETPGQITPIPPPQIPQKRGPWDFNAPDPIESNEAMRDYQEYQMKVDEYNRERASEQVAAEAEVAKQKELAAKSDTQRMLMMTEAQKAWKILKENPNAGGLIGVGQWHLGVPGAPGTIVGNALEAIRANIGFERLSQMRRESSTGGAVGQVSNFEQRLLQAAMGSLEHNLGTEELLFRLERYYWIQDAILNPEPGKLRAVLNKYSVDASMDSYDVPSDPEEQQSYVIPGIDYSKSVKSLLDGAIRENEAAAGADL